MGGFTAEFPRRERRNIEEEKFSLISVHLRYRPPLIDDGLGEAKHQLKVIKRRPCSPLPEIVEAGD